MEKNPTIFIAKELVRQVESESPESLLWIISSINRCLSVNENMGLVEFKDLIKSSCPDFFDNYKQIMQDKNLVIID